MALPLTGIRILDLTRLLPGPLGSQVLVDFGAEVIKIEDTQAGDYIRWQPPMIGEYSALFYSLNRGKKSVKLNLKEEKGKEIFRRLVKEADVLLEGFRPGVMDKLGLGYEELKKINPRLIYCAVTGYGYTGPYRELAGHDINYLNIAGITSLIGHRDEKPVVPGIQVADIGGGSLWTIIAVLLALRAREITGRGQFCDVAMLDGVLSWLVFPLAIFSTTGQRPVRGGEFLSGGYAFYNIYPTADGKFISLGALEPKFWVEFCRRIGKEEYIDKQYDPKEQNALIAELTRMFRQRSQAEWVEFFADNDFCFTPVLEIEGVLSDPQVREREMLVKTQVEGKELIMAGIPVKLSDTPGVISHQFAKHGEHTRLVLEGLGFSDEEIQEMEKQGII